MWRRLLLPLLRRDPAEISRRAAGFHIATDAGRDLVARLGSAFLEGYNAVLELRDLAEVSERGLAVSPRFRPFFFEGAAMGYLPRVYLGRSGHIETAEGDLITMHPSFLYLYYVGLGFWFGIRHPYSPRSVGGLAPHVDPLYMPLCYDGWGFKLGFFDYLAHPGRVRRFETAPSTAHPWLFQGLGRALFFVFMDDEAGFRRTVEAAPHERREDMEHGRSLALAFTGIDRPERVLQHLREASERERPARLTGVTWALTARERGDRDYFMKCVAAAPQGAQGFLRSLPETCRRCLECSSSYQEWQQRTRAAAVTLYEDFIGAGAKVEA